jgi:NAD(P)-dependent dehydrogenase (short-subunit alcohol dehydrogenase family)
VSSAIDAKIEPAAARLQEATIMRVTDRTAIVTGGASGLGEACVRLFVAAGGRVLVADVNDDRGQKLAGELGAGVRFAHVDVTDEASVQAALDLAAKELGGVSICVQCAGIVHGEKLLGRNGPHALATFARVIGVNLIGTFNVMRLAAAAMEKNAPGDDGERGVIINTASVAAFEGQIGQAAYAASKGGVASLTLPAARELAAKGIRVVAIAPGLFATPMMASLPEAVQTSLAAQTPFPPRLGRPEEFAALVEHAIENVMLNGCVLRLDGAIRMAPK